MLNSTSSSSKVVVSGSVIGNSGARPGSIPTPNSGARNVSAGSNDEF